MSTTLDLYRPFGAGAPLATGIACNLYCDVARGRGVGPASGTLLWTHFIEVDFEIDIRDGCTRTAGIDAPNYADGDQVFIPNAASGDSYVVVWVEVRRDADWQRLSGGDVQQDKHKRVYLMRHTAAW